MSQHKSPNGQSATKTALEENIIERARIDSKSLRGLDAILFGSRLSAEEMERENRIRDLLPDEDEDDIRNFYDGAMLVRLLRYLMPYRTRLIVAVIAMALSSLFNVVRPLIIGYAIDLGIKGRSIGALRYWALLFIAAAVLEWITNRTRIQLMAYAGTRVVADMRSQLFRHLHKLSLGFHNNYSVGRLMSRLISDVGVLQDFVTWSITGMARSTFILAGSMIAMFVMNWQLALATMTILPLMIVLTNYWRKRVRQVYRASRTRLSLINGYLNESITGIRVTKSFSREEKNFAYFDDLNSSYLRANVDAARLTAIFFPGVDFMAYLAMAVVVAFAGWKGLSDITAGAVTTGTLVAFVFYVDRFFEPVREVAQRYNTFQATMAGCERIFSLLDTEPELPEPADLVELPPIDGCVDFEDVSFSYNDDEPVLRGINLHAEPGEQIALVGETGAGKSTIIRLISRFFDVTSGSLKIDGHDIRDVTQASLRSQLGIVLQDTFLFGGTLADNIRYGRLDATDDEVIAAAKAVGADEFISALPDGYATEVGEDGVNLSVGQRQLISFARALLADPRVLILDEATSSVDTATERQIQQALETLMSNRTSFVIAHRLNTIVNSDKIVVLDQGRIVEMGSHAELLAQQGRYFNLYTMQWATQEGGSSFSEN